MKRARESKHAAVRLRRSQRLTAGMVHHRAPAWSSGGRLLACSLGEDLDSHWVIIDRKGRMGRVVEGPVGGSASFASDGSLAYSRQVGATSEIWLLPPAGALPKRWLGGDGRLYRDPAYSPDGRYLCYLADDGPAETGSSGLRLWLLDLAREEHRILIANLPNSSGRDEERRLGPPAWSPTGDRIYFDVSDGAGSMIYAVAPSGEPPEPVSELGYRRPAPLASGRLVCERARIEGSDSSQSELVLLDHRPGTATAQVTPLLGSDARDPAVVFRKDRWLLCFAMPCRTSAEEPHRYDLHLTELAGVAPPSTPGHRRGSRARSTDGSTEGDPLASAPELEEQREAELAAAAASERPRSAASVWLDRPLCYALGDEELPTP